MSYIGPYLIFAMIGLGRICSTMARRIQFAKRGGPEVLEYVKFTPSEPSGGEVRVKLHAIGLNYIDTYYRSGIYPVPSLPSGLGGEGAGVIDAVGPGVSQFKVGDRVAYLQAFGSDADYHTVKVQNVVKLPEKVSFETAAAILLKGLTVQYLLRKVYKPERGETVLFHAAAGGVGLIFLQWAHHLGIKVIATAGTEEKLKLAKHFGAWETINYNTEDFARRVSELTNGKKVKVVYDSVGKSTFEGSLNSLAKRGLLVSFGNASGPVKDVDLGIFTAKGSLFVTRPSLGGYIDSHEDLIASSDELFDLVEKDVIQVDIPQKYSLAETRKAHEQLESRKTTGSSVIYPEEFFKAI